MAFSLSASRAKVSAPFRSFSIALVFSPLSTSVGIAYSPDFMVVTGLHGIVSISPVRTLSSSSGSTSYYGPSLGIIPSLFLKCFAILVLFLVLIYFTGLTSGLVDFVGSNMMNLIDTGEYYERPNCTEIIFSLGSRFIYPTYLLHSSKFPTSRHGLCSPKKLIVDKKNSSSISFTPSLIVLKLSGFYNLITFLGGSSLYEPAGGLTVPFEKTKVNLPINGGS